MLGAAFRYYEATRAAVWRVRHPRIAREEAEGLPLPPARLRVMVQGTPDAQAFLTGGRLMAEELAQAASGAGAELSECDEILDFGCGCGRIARHWSSLEGAHVHGRDYNAALVDWCRSNLPFGEFGVNGRLPPLDLPDEAVDLVYAVSVFTHMPAAEQLAWIGELERVVRPGGLVLLTTHGEAHRERLTERERSQFREGRLVVRFPDTAGTNVCIAFHPPSYVRERLSARVEYVAFTPATAGSLGQDIHVLRRPSPGGLPA